MKGYVLSPAAQRDLDDIWDFSAATWSPAQANRYVEQIRAACGKLGAGKSRGRSIEDIIGKGLYQTAKNLQRLLRPFLAQIHRSIQLGSERLVLAHDLRPSVRP